MARFCYICNKRLHEWHQNLTEIKLNHSKSTISRLLKKFLRDVQSQRDVDDSSNCICTECLDAFNEYDWMHMTARKKEKELRILFLTTESMFLNSDKKVESPVNVACASDEEAKFEFEDQELEDENVQDDELPSDDDESTNEETQGSDFEDDDSQHPNAKDQIPQKEDEHYSPIKEDSVENNIEIDTMKQEYDKIENSPMSESEHVTVSVALSNESKLAELTKQIEEVRRRKPRLINSKPRANIRPPVKIPVEPPTKAEQPEIATRYECEICKDGKDYQNLVEFNFHKKGHKKWCQTCDRKFQNFKAYAVCIEITCEN